MKTLKEVNQEIDELLKSVNKHSHEKEVKSVKSKVAFLRMIVRYLETAPREEYIKSSLSEVKRRIELIPTHYEAWKTGRVLSKYKDPYAAYCTEMGLTEMKSTVKTLEYILA